MTAPTTAQLMNAVIDAMIARIETNKTALGISSVEERDEMPGYVEPGACFVIPLVEGRDVMRTPIGGGPLEHEIPVTIVAHYRTETVAAGLRSTRDRGYGMIDLFHGSHAAETVEGSVVEEGEGEEPDVVLGTALAYTADPTLEVGYARVADYVLHWYIVKISLKTVI